MTMLLHELSSLTMEYRKLQPIEDDILKRLNQKFRLEFNFNSNHLAGNTLSYAETKLLLLFDHVKENHEMRELQEMKAHDVALSIIKQESQRKKRPLTEKFIKDLHGIILIQDFWKDVENFEGEVVPNRIRVGKYKEYTNNIILPDGDIFEYASPEDTATQMSELVDWFNRQEIKQELSPIELASMLHYRYIQIHPFADGNGRIARLLVNYVLFRYDFPPIVIKADDRENYQKALLQSRREGIRPFLIYMTDQLAWSIYLCIRAAKGKNIEKQNDWERKLDGLKRGLGQSREIKITKSKKSISDVFRHTLVPFAIIYDEKMSQFGGVFLDQEYTVKYSHLEKEVFVRRSSKLLSLISSSFGLQFEVEFNINYDQLHLCSHFATYKKPYLEYSISSTEIRFDFKTYGYTVRYGSKVITKLYDESLSELEMNNIIDYIANDLLHQIDEMLTEGHFTSIV